MKNVADNQYWIYAKTDPVQEEMREKSTLSYVTFLDILGFKNMVLRNPDKAMLTQRQIVGFCNYYYKEKDERNENLRDYGLVTTVFSDSVVITADVENWPLHEFVGLIENLQYFLLTEGVLIRGGIDIGKVFHDEEFVFGEGIIDAYLIENNVSEYPRIVLSNRVVKYSLREQQNRYDEELEYMIQMKQPLDLILDTIDSEYTYDIFDCVSKDEHGIYYLEYLLHGLNDEYDDDEREQQTEKIKNLIGTGIISCDARVREKYEWLNEYFNRTVNQKSTHGENNFDEEERRLQEMCKKEPRLAEAFDRTAGTQWHKREHK